MFVNLVSVMRITVTLVIIIQVSVILFNVILTKVILQSVIFMGVIVLNVVEPSKELSCHFSIRDKVRHIDILLRFILNLKFYSLLKNDLGFYILGHLEHKYF